MGIEWNSAAAASNRIWHGLQLGYYAFRSPTAPPAAASSREAQVSVPAMQSNAKLSSLPRNHVLPPDPLRAGNPYRIRAL